MGSGNKRDKKKESPCANLRAAYNNCFNRWYAEKFVKGQWDKEECVSQWQQYRACLAEHLDNKQLSRLLEAETTPSDLINLVDGPGSG